MLFNSYIFFVFFSLFFLAYWFLFSKTVKIQNLFLLTGSIFFYIYWDYRLFVILIFSVVFSYYIGDKISSSSHKKKWLIIGISIILIQLMYFKYFNFFIESFQDLFLINKTSFSPLNIIIPLGISYYTFRIISYFIDIKNAKIKPCKDFIIYANYVIFFPTIVSGPIDRAKMLIPQLEIKREFNQNNFSEGLRQILWGLFKKLVIADNCALLTTEIMSNYQTMHGSTLLIGSIIYFIQLYADFSGYSDMALGVSKTLGLSITKNFNYPLFANSIPDYWRRWHISLTSWLTDYVFTPLSIYFRDYRKWGICLSILITFTLIGFWHGANWHYIWHGVVSGLMFIPNILNGKFAKSTKYKPYKYIPSIKEIKDIALTFITISLLTILFSSKNMEMALEYYKGIFSETLFIWPNVKLKLYLALLIIFFLLIEWIGKKDNFAIEKQLNKFPIYIRWSFYYVLFLLMCYYYQSPQEFIYQMF